MKVAEKIAANLLKKIIIREEAEWPPVCSGLIYQPERPVVGNTKSTKNTYNKMNNSER